MLDELGDVTLAEGIEDLERTYVGLAGTGAGRCGRVVHHARLRDGGVLVVGASDDLRDRLLGEGAVELRGGALRLPPASARVGLGPLGCSNCVRGNCPAAARAARRLGLPLAARGPSGFTRRRTIPQRRTA
jgi:hypothetical protein